MGRAKGRSLVVITDPPYGIRADENPVRGSDRHERIGWDRERPEREIFDEILRHGSAQIIWGGNYFTDLLPPSMCWLVWDKGQTDFSLADCEFAWNSKQGAARRLMLPRSEALKDGKEHPTQKPVRLMVWCLEKHPSAQTVCDPFMGTGTTGVACMQRGLRFVGIERERAYFDIACRRIEQAQAQGTLLPPEETRRPVQEGLL